MKRALSKWWFIPLVFAAGIAILCFHCPSIWYPIIWTKLCVGFFCWWYFSLINLVKGSYTNVKNLGGNLATSVLGIIPGSLSNDPDEPYYDDRYPAFWHIPVVEKVKKTWWGKSVKLSSWGAPGYEKEENPIFDKQDINTTRSYIETKFGKKYVGLWPFFRVSEQPILARKMIEVSSITKKITGNEKDIDDFPDWSIHWIDNAKTKAIIQREKMVKARTVYTREFVVILSAETGFKPKKQKDTPAEQAHSEDEPVDQTTMLAHDEHAAIIDEDEMLQINVPVEMQVRSRDPFSLAIKTVNMQTPLDSIISEKMRDFIARNSIDTIQSGNHSQPNSEFKTELDAVNGHWEKPAKDGCQYKLSPGALENFGFEIVTGFFLKWDPANKHAEDMLFSHQRVYISNQDKLVLINEGIGAGSKHAEIVNRMADSDSNYRKKMVAAGADPNWQAFTEGMGNHQGAFVWGDTGGLTKILNVDNGNLGAPIPTKENKAEEKEKEKKSETKPKKGGKDDSHDEKSHH